MYCVCVSICRLDIAIQLVHLRDAASTMRTRSCCIIVDDHRLEADIIVLFTLQLLNLSLYHRCADFEGYCVAGYNVAEQPVVLCFSGEETAHAWFTTHAYGLRDAMMMSQV